MKEVPTDVTHEIKSQNEPSLSIISIMWILKLAKYTQRSRKQICTFWFSKWRKSQKNELKDLNAAVFQSWLCERVDVL